MQMPRCPGPTFDESEDPKVRPGNLYIFNSDVEIQPETPKAVQNPSRGGTPVYPRNQSPVLFRPSVSTWKRCTLPPQNACSPFRHLWEPSHGCTKTYFTALHAPDSQGCCAEKCRTKLSSSHDGQVSADSCRFKSYLYRENIPSLHQHSPRAVSNSTNVLHWLLRRLHFTLLPELTPRSQIANRESGPLCIPWMPRMFHWFKNIYCFFQHCVLLWKTTVNLWYDSTRCSIGPSPQQNGGKLFFKKLFKASGSEHTGI